MKKPLSWPKMLAIMAMIVIAIGIAVVLIIIPWSRSTETNPAQINWPTKEWQSTIPEKQGIDSSKLAEALLSIREKNINIHSLLIIRNGLVAADASFYPYDGKTVHEMASVTKSLMTTLIGIAADQGKLELDQPMVSFFPERTIASRDDLKEQITVRHLASMSSGLESLGYAMDEGTLKQMEASEDWIQFALDRPVVSEPGTHFVYDSPGMHLLSAILQEATGVTANEFARQNLFEPLGISDVIWPVDPQGYNHGWGDVYLHPRDVAKLGYLWLNKGEWDGKQIISREWVENSVKVQMKTGGSDDYGYGWWIMSGSDGEFAAIGRGGQRIQVFPALNLMLVTTGGGFDITEIIPFLEPTLVDPSKALPQNPAGVTKLNEALASVAKAPVPKQAGALPEIAGTVSGKTYLINSNPAQLKSLQLDFNDSDEAILHLAYTDGRPDTLQKIGLDGVYRMGTGEFDLPQGMRGYWEDDQTFFLEQDEIAVNDHTMYRVTFKGDTIEINGLETAHEFGVTFEGRLEN